MTARTHRYRVAADFTENERDALDALCAVDYRPPPELLRWLVVQEARKRGILGDPPPATIPPMTNGAANGLGTRGAALTTP